MNRTLPSCLGMLILAFTVVVQSGGAQTKDICLPEAEGVPSLGSGPPMDGPPIWWAGVGTVVTRFDDPRWNGAVSQSFDGKVEFRALHRTGTPDTLFFSWLARIDHSLESSDVATNTTGDPQGDQLVVGIKQQSGVALILHLGLASDADAQVAEKNGVAFKAYTWDGTNLLPAGTLSWFLDTKAAWTWEDVPNTTARWAFQMAVPITPGPTPGVNIPNPFEMFYAVIVEMPSEIVGEPTSFPEYLWPSTISRVRNPTSGIVSFPDPTDAARPWGKVRWGTSSNCAGDVALDANQIGSQFPPQLGPLVPLDWRIVFKRPPATPNDTGNYITAKPTNLGGTEIAAGRIQADFYVSNYGSQIDNPAFWKKISPLTPPTSTAIAPGGLGFIQFRWPVPDDDRCLYIDNDLSICDPPGIDDQCILVQLSEVPPPPAPPPPPGAPPPPPSLVFQNQSVYMNMVFREASTLRHRAQISVVGLEPLAGSRTTRDVYLYVETVNMPARTSGDSKPAVTRLRDSLIVARHDTSVMSAWGVMRLKKGDSVRIPLRIPVLASGASAFERFEAVKRGAANGKLTVPEVDAAVPTYRIHAYHTTGDSLGKGPILEPQTSFGYWVQHDGEIYGWRHRIEGERLVQLAPNYYKIEVPNNGRTIITTIIEPLPWRRLTLGLHGGISIPTGNFTTTHDRGYGVTADAEYWLSRRIGVAALVGYHHFPGTALATNTDVDILHVSAALEVRVTTGNPSILIDAGGGTYKFDPGSSERGAHGGVGIEFDVSPRISLGVTGRLHTVFTTGSNTTFYALQAGGRFRL